MLLREIRRLRNENSSLRTSVSMLKDDLRDINVSRQDTDASHKKFYDEYMDKNTQLEIDIEDRNDEIKSLKQEIDRLKQCHLCHSNNSHHRASSSGNHHNPFGCYEFDEDEDIFCQPVAHVSALPEIDIKMDELKVDDADDEDARAMNDYLHRRFNLVDISQQEEEEEEDEEEEDVKDDLTLFEPTATSYIHQAMISKLSSTRVRLELDDLILKYEPSCEDIVRVLSFSFVDWVSSLLVKFVNKSGPEPVSATKVFTSHIQNGIVEFWESLLQYYTSEEDCQIDLLNRIEHDIDIIPSGTAIGDHFDRLVLMLYKYHVIDDDAVISWWQNPLDNENSRKIRKITTRFVEWVQDEDEEDDDEDEDDSDQEGDNDDEDDDDDGMFSFVESPVSEDQIELNNESSDNELEVNQTDGSSSIDALLTNQDRELCVCHLDKDTSTMPKKNEPCSCSTYTPSPVIEKKKKSVRIAL